MREGHLAFKRMKYSSGCPQMHPLPPTLSPVSKFNDPIVVCFPGIRDDRVQMSKG